MPDTFVELPADSTGKRLRMVLDGTLTDDGYPVYTQVVQLHDEDIFRRLLEDILKQLTDINTTLQEKG